jgi:ankyrin repeat protein
MESREYKYGILSDPNIDIESEYGYHNRLKVVLSKSEPSKTGDLLFPLVGTTHRRALKFIDSYIDYEYFYDSNEDIPCIKYYIDSGHLRRDQLPQLLYDSIIRDNVELVRFLIGYGVRLDMAAVVRSPSIMRFLIQNNAWEGADKFTRPYYNRTNVDLPLIVKLILSVSDDANNKYEGLRRAVQIGYIESVNLFISAGVELTNVYEQNLYLSFMTDATPEFRNKMLAQACLNKHYNAANRLIDMGAQVIFGYTLSYDQLLQMVTILSDIKDIILFGLLDRIGIDINTYKDKLLEDLLTKDIKIVRRGVLYLVSIGAKVKDPLQLLYMFFSINNFERFNIIDNNIKELSASGIDYELYKNELLVMMCTEVNEVSVRYLLNRDANVHYQNDLPLRRIIEVITNGDEDEDEKTRIDNEAEKVVYILLRHGADIHINNDKPLCDAIRSRNRGVVGRLLDGEANPNANEGEPLLIAIDLGLIYIVNDLIAYGADVHIRDDEPIRCAIVKNYQNIVKSLLDYGANLNARNNSFLPLISVAMYTTVNKFYTVGSRSPPLLISIDDINIDDGP